MVVQHAIRILFALFLFTLTAQAQQTAYYTEALRFYKRGVTFFDQGIYSKAQDEFTKAVELLEPVNEARSILLRNRAELGIARAAIRLDRPEAEIMALNFVREHSPEPLADEALVEIGNYYFDDRQYEKALAFYERVPFSSLPGKQKDELHFKMGYAHFVNKEFDEAKGHFVEVKDEKNDYYYPTNYYLGLCYFFEGNYENAIDCFQVVESSGQYDDFVPYYTSQIYFAMRRYDDLIQYAEPRLQRSPSLRNRSEMMGLLGQAYFEKGNYNKALPLLETYAEKADKLQEEELYQLGFAYYQNGRYDKAIPYFRELATAKSAIGQSGMFYLADSYLRLGDRNNARIAMAEAKRMNFDPRLTEEAIFNYGKLSYELGSPYEAISAFRSIPPNSPYYGQSQMMMSDVLLTFRDYEQGLEILETLQPRTPEMNTTYQKLSLYRGYQLLQAGETIEAKKMLAQSVNSANDAKAKATALYWLGDISYREGRYDESINYLNQHLNLASTLGGLPDESSVYMSNYLLGYNYLKKQDFGTATRYFQEAVSGIQRNRGFIDNERIRKQVLGDATLRAGDSYFKRNQYPDALRFYDYAIQERQAGYVYALYQKGIIQGLQNQSTEKILSMERITQEFPDSEWADDAFFQLGSTYQDMGRLPLAAPPLEQLIAKYRTSSDLVNESLIKLGLISYNQGQTEQAINYYKQVFSNNPTPDESKLALEALEEIYVKDLSDPGSYFAFLETLPGYDVNTLSRDSVSFRSAEFQFENGQYQQAANAYTNYLQQFPNGRYALTAHYHRGESYSVLGQYSQALQDYQTVANAGPSTYYLKALEKSALIAYNHEQNFQLSYDLYRQLEQAAQQEDLKFEAQLGALRSAYRSGNGGAVQELAGKVANNPNASELQAASAYFYQGKLAYDQRNYNMALQAFEQVKRLSDNEQTAEARYLEAEIYYQMRNLEKARQLCLNANKESSAYPYWVAKSVLLLAEIMTEQGDLLNARAALEALIENYQGDQALLNQAQARLDQLNQQISSGSRLDTDDNSDFMQPTEGSRP